MTVQLYLVGGAVRDELLGLTPKDLDYVVVGQTEEQMIAQGFQRVGADFPVFLHPKTKDEYALARTERKSGKGYNGFTVETDSVTIEEDLMRRCLTINSMAKDLVTGEIIDPFGGQEDLKNGILRHTSIAFAEDPLRVLRVARFAARYNFNIAYDTMVLMCSLVDTGELDHLTPERVWAETEKALSEPFPEKYFEVLDTCGALAVIMPEFTFNHNVVLGGHVVARFAKMAIANLMSGPTVDAMCSRLKIPNEVRDVTKVALKIHYTLNTDRSGSVTKLFLDTGAFRNPVQFGHGALAVLTQTQCVMLMELLSECLTVNAASLGLEGVTGKAVGDAIAQARADIVNKNIPMNWVFA